MLQSLLTGISANNSYPQPNLQYQKWDYLNRHMYVDQISRPDYIEQMNNASDYHAVNEAIRVHQNSQKKTFNKCVSKFYKGSTFEFQCKLGGSAGDYLVWEDLTEQQKFSALNQMRSHLINAADSRFADYDQIMTGSPAVPTQVPSVKDTGKMYENADGQVMYMDEFKEGETVYDPADYADKLNITVGDDVGVNANTKVETVTGNKTLNP